MRRLRLSLVGMVTLALFGGLGGVALAQADTDTAKVTHFTGTRLSAVEGAIDEWWEADGIGHARGLHATETIEWSDPRLPSELQMVQNIDALGQEAVVTGATLLEDPEGYWTGEFTAYCDPDSDCHGMNTITGHGAYEGLFAVFRGFYADGPESDWVFDGVIYEGETLPIPDALEPTVGGLGTVVAAQQTEQAGGSENAIAATSVWTSKGVEDEPLTRLNSVNLAPDGNLWVLDGPEARFQILSPDGAFIETWGTTGTGEGEFDFVRPDGLSYGDVAFAPDGSYYVVESGNQRVQRFDADRRWVTMWGSKGEADGQFLDPIGAAVAPDGNVYVADDQRDDVQVFDPDGVFLFAFGGQGSGPGQIQDAGFLDIAADGTVYVADFNAHRVIKYATDGAFLTEWGSAGDGPYAFNNPQGIAVGPDGLVYLADFRNGKVKVFDGDGQHLATWPDPTDEAPVWSMSGPVSIDVDDEGDVYVSEYFTALVRKLATEPVMLPASIAATSAETTAPVQPTPPLPPDSGPGSPNTTYPEAVWTHYGEDPGGFWIIEPSTTPDALTLPEGTGALPVVVFLTGCCDQQTQMTDVTGLKPWISHVSRQGMVVISPVYSPPKAAYDPLRTVPEIQQLVRDALAELAEPGHPAIDTTRTGVIGASFGGVPAIIYTSQAGSLGLPVPKGLFLHAPCEEYCGIRVPPGTTLPAGLKVVEMTFEHDQYMSLTSQKRVYETFLAMPPEDREFVRMYRDDHGDPRLEGDHFEGAYEPDTWEYHGVFKVSTAMMTCAIDGVWCEYALGDTPEQRSMGTWSDGVPVKELVVVDDPVDLES